MSDLLSSTTVLARIMTALDHATACQYSDVMDILNARGLDDEPTAGDILAVCVVLDLPAGVLLGAVGDDLRGVEHFPSTNTDHSGDVYQL